MVRWFRVALLAAWSACLFLPGLDAQPPGKSTQARIQKKSYDFKDAKKELEFALFVPST
jgi:hypothetical protein